MHPWGRVAATGGRSRSTPALHRMERRGWLEAEWGDLGEQPQVRLYRLTSRGRARLRSETEGWTAFAAAIGKVLQAAEAG